MVCYYVYQYGIIRTITHTDCMLYGTHTECMLYGTHTECMLYGTHTDCM